MLRGGSLVFAMLTFATAVWFLRDGVGVGRRRLQDYAVVAAAAAAGGRGTTPSPFDAAADAAAAATLLNDTLASSNAVLEYPPLAESAVFFPSRDPPTEPRVVRGDVAALVAARMSECAARGSTPRAAEVAVTSLYQSELLLPEEGPETGSTVVGYIVARDREGKLVCREGDMFDVTAWSDRNRAPVHMRTAASSGVYQFSFRPVTAGVFRVCVYLFFPSAAGLNKTWPDNPVRGPPGGAGGSGGAGDGAATYTHTEKTWQEVTEAVSGVRTKADRVCGSARSEYAQHCLPLRVRGADALPTAVCGRAWGGGRGLAGSWVRGPKGQREKCYPGLCEGDLRFMDSAGWVYVPQACYLRLYNREAAWSCVAGRKLMWFGDSTLKQPATNLVENLLGVPVLRRSFNWVANACPSWGSLSRNPRKFNKQYSRFRRNGCTGPFDHRMWKITRENPSDPSQKVTLQFVWGGAKGVDRSPFEAVVGFGLLDDKTTTQHQAVFNALLGKRGAADKASSDARPDAFFIHQYVWDRDAKMRHESWEGRVLEFLKTTALADGGPELGVHWDTAHPQCLFDQVDDQATVCKSAVENKVNSVGSYLSGVRMVNLLEKEFAGNDKVTVSDRYTMAQPFSVRSEYCYFGIHFGSQPAFCHVTLPTSPKRCYRNWLVDKYEQMIWMNKMCSNTPPASSASNVTFEVCLRFLGKCYAECFKKINTPQKSICNTLLIDRLESWMNRPTACLSNSAKLLASLFPPPSSSFIPASASQHSSLLPFGLS